MTNDDRVQGTEETLCALADETQPASGSDVGVDPTLAAPSPARRGNSQVGVRAEPGHDYAELREVDPANYVLGQELARGGMGRIRTARDRRLGREVAIKELLHLGSDARARFEREARITARLQHPAIVGILEAGTWPGGEPFYAMKLVAGEALDRAIAKRPSLEARLALLPNVIAVADALAFAHSRRVIHRDLKPGNVLVGEFGETVVIDWGLAKDLTLPDGDPDASGALGEGAAGAHRTVAGAVMGTPAYMPREQAAGEPVDEGADVYAIGAILYHLLAGVPPYSGSTTEEVLEKVLSSSCAPLRDVVPAAPVDLIAIVEKAMAVERRARYGSAVDLVADLKRFQTGQLVGAHRYTAWHLAKRWLRRHRAVVGVAGLAVCLLVTGAVISVRRILSEQAATEAQRTLAEVRRAEAEDLLGYMLVDLKDKLEPLGKLPLLQDVAERATRFFATRPTTNEPGDLEARATVLVNVGEVLLAQGDAVGAVSQFQAALAIRRSLLARDPASDSVRLAVADALAHAGEGSMAQGDSTAALALHQEALALREQAALNLPADRKVQGAAAESHRAVGDVLMMRGDLEGAGGAFERALGIATGLATVAPEDPEWHAARGAASERLGKVARASGDGAGALVHYRAALEVAESLALRDPGDAIRRRDVAAANDRIGFVQLYMTGDVSGAETSFRTSVELLQRLVADDPTNAAWKRDLALAHQGVGEAARAAGRLAEARAALDVARGLLQLIVDVDPTRSNWRRELAVVEEALGDLALSQGDLDAARARYLSSLGVRERLVAEDPANTDSMVNLAISYQRFGLLHEARGDLVAAELQYLAYLMVYSRVTAADPSNQDWQAGLALGHSQLGSVQLARGAYVAATSSFRAALAIRQAVRARSPDSVAALDNLADSHRRLADAAEAMNELALAVDERRRALELSVQVARADRADTRHRRTIVFMGAALANTLRLSGQHAEAVEVLRTARGTAEALLAVDRGNVQWIQDRLGLTEMLADALVAAGDVRAAVEEYELARSLYRQRLADDGPAARDAVARLTRTIAALRGAR
jgi:tetratricopeptide (TPR) repeat protein